MKSENFFEWAAGSFYLGLIPGALGGAAVIWLMFVTNIINLEHQKTIAQRMDNRVGIAEPLNNPVSLTIRKEDCLVVTRAYIDGVDGVMADIGYGGKLTLYITNYCGKTPSYYTYNWEEVAPDGTIIHSDYGNGGPNPRAGETVEVMANLPDDKRATKVIAWAGKSSFN